jgi:hypothetical protein
VFFGWWWYLILCTVYLVNVHTFRWNVLYLFLELLGCFWASVWTNSVTVKTEVVWSSETSDYLSTTRCKNSKDSHRQIIPAVIQKYCIRIKRQNRAVSQNFMFTEMIFMPYQLLVCTFYNLIFLDSNSIFVASVCEVTFKFPSAFLNMWSYIQNVGDKTDLKFSSYNLSHTSTRQFRQ